MTSYEYECEFIYTQFFYICNYNQSHISPFVITNPNFSLLALRMKDKNCFKKHYYDKL